MDRERERAQSRVGADVARRLLATDVLLASRKREYEAAPPFSVHCLASETAWHLAHVLGPRREQTNIRSAEIERVAETLAFSDRNVGVHLARGAQRAESNRIGEDRNQESAARVRRLGDGGQVARIAEEVGRLNNHAARLVVDYCGDVFTRVQIRG